MDRLTFEGNFCDISQCEATPGGSFCEDGACSQREVWERLKEYEDAGVSPETLRHARQFEDGVNKGGYSVKRMVELMEADKEGRVVVLPCKAGDTVYLLRGRKVTECYAYRIQVTKCGIDVFLKNDDIDGVPRTALEFGQTVFLTREEAEKR